ncbi:hypothetical protein BKA82DRAFT_597857 [Pisolithus tinctorius]|uniref:Uncharacterized protein n=1 Tax=Pisolithus tinctorius Marx 270 TaxID=870435 RepID=A0A0C3K397_PISTI|nr:hypothetical protein BKA82DRAFT_597857 [Pisolithus tinctorius]KIO03987.1 hypothetical protein M404DRAFT_597857 [Pisolithus tinctorius Marx 270]
MHAIVALTLKLEAFLKRDTHRHLRNLIAIHTKTRYARICGRTRSESKVCETKWPPPNTSRLGLPAIRMVKARTIADHWHWQGEDVNVGVGGIKLSAVLCEPQR